MSGILLLLAMQAYAEEAKKSEALDSYIQRFNAVFKLADENVGRPSNVVAAKYFDHLSADEKKCLSRKLTQDSRPYFLRLNRVRNELYLVNIRFAARLATFDLSKYRKEKTIFFNGKSFELNAINDQLSLRGASRYLASSQSGKFGGACDYSGRDNSVPRISDLFEK